MKNVSSLPVAVIGAGPIGLAAAAHLAERDISFIVFEAGPAVGHNLASYQHVRLFSPWRFNSDHAAVRLLESEGWSAPDLDLLPTAGEVVADPAAANGTDDEKRTEFRNAFDRLSMKIHALLNLSFDEPDDHQTLKQRLDAIGRNG